MVPEAMEMTTFCESPEGSLPGLAAVEALHTARDSP